MGCVCRSGLKPGLKRFQPFLIKQFLIISSLRNHYESRRIIFIVVAFLPTKSLTSCKQINHRPSHCTFLTPCYWGHSHRDLQAGSDGISCQGTLFTNNCVLNPACSWRCTAAGQQSGQPRAIRKRVIAWWHAGSASHDVNNVYVISISKTVILMTPSQGNQWWTQGARQPIIKLACPPADVCASQDAIFPTWKDEKNKIFCNCSAVVFLPPALSVAESGLYPPHPHPQLCRGNQH